MNGIGGRLVSQKLSGLKLLFIGVYLVHLGDSTLREGWQLMLPVFLDCNVCISYPTGR